MTDLRRWQIAGVVWIVLTYALFVLAARDMISIWWGWIAAFVVGVIELITIFGYDSNITRFVRNMYRRPIDLVVLFGLLVLTWGLAGELAAGFLLIGWLNSHFHEHE